MKAVIYARVSTTRQGDEGVSLELQVDRCIRYADERGWGIVAEYREAESALEYRQKYEELLRRAKAGEFSVVIVYRMDRFGRDAADYLTSLKELRRAGVEVHSVTEPTDNDFVRGLMGLLGEEESRRLSSRVTPAMEARAREGKWLGGRPPSGYDLAPAPDGKGKTLRPNGDAPKVRYLFELYASGRASLRDLAREAHSLGLSGWTRYGWQQTEAPMLRTSFRKILSNPVYIGMVRWNAQGRGKFRPGGKRPEDEQITARGLHEAIIPRELWDAVQERLGRNRHHPPTRPKRLPAYQHRLLRPLWRS